MLDLYLDPTTGDISFENGDIVKVPTKQELCRQQVAIALKAFRGEWFRDIAFGVPYLENENNPVQILGNKDVNIVNAEIRRVILNEPTVLSISKYEVTHDNESGGFQIDVEVISEEGPVSLTTTI